jgi:hypothetical protein
MAIIKSAAVGNATGSLGNITYQNYKNRTIGKQKVNPGKSARYNATETQHMQRARMAVVGHFAKLVQTDIKQNFRETMTGWANNGFMRTNFIVLSVAFDEAIQLVYNKEVSARNLSFDYLNEMIKTFVSANPESIVYSDNASTLVFVSADGWPTPPLPLVIESLTYELPPMGDPTPVSSLPYTIQTNALLNFYGNGLSKSRIRLTIAGSTYILGATQDTLVSTNTLTRIEVKMLSNAVGSMTKIEYLDETGAWQTYLSTSALSRYKQQMRNVKQKQEEKPAYNAF